MTKLCEAKLYLADDYGDNTCTITCQLEQGHAGFHKEHFYRSGSKYAGNVTITWENDETGTRAEIDEELDKLLEHDWITVRA